MINSTKYDLIKLIRHHIAYEEIDGFDYIVWMSRSEHMKLHLLLNRIGWLSHLPKYRKKEIQINAFGRISRPSLMKYKEGELIVDVKEAFSLHLCLIPNNMD